MISDMFTSRLAVREKNNHRMDNKDVHDCWFAGRPLKADLILWLWLHTVMRHTLFFSYQQLNDEYSHISVSIIKGFHRKLWRPNLQNVHINVAPYSVSEWENRGERALSTAPSNLFADINIWSHFTKLSSHSDRTDSMQQKDKNTPKLYRPTGRQLQSAAAVPSSDTHRTCQSLR